MTEFEFDKESADRIEKVIKQHPMCLKDCADILELLAPLCDFWSATGLKAHIRGAFSAQLIMAQIECVERLRTGQHMNDFIEGGE